jgi:hypothetical protein
MELVDWWTNFQELSPAERDKLTQARAPAKRRRRPRRRKPAVQSHV